MQRLNVLTLAAFLIGLAAFLYDASTPQPARVIADASAWNGAQTHLMLDSPFEPMAGGAHMAASLD